MAIKEPIETVPGAIGTTPGQVRQQLARTRPHLAPVFDPETLASVPAPAQRLLARALPLGVTLRRSVELEMAGRIKLRRWWLPFRARQLLEAGRGFVWEPVVGRRLVRFEGADVLSTDFAEMEFRLFGRLPVVSATGPDVARSALGRLAAETVAWLPQAITPQLGAVWTPVDEATSRVRLEVVGEHVDVDVTVAADGRLAAVALDRWGAPEGGVPSWHRFGGSMSGEHITSDGVRIAGRGTVGWGWGSDRWQQGEFFRFDITSAEHPAAASR